MTKDMKNVMFLFLACFVVLSCDKEITTDNKLKDILKSHDIRDGVVYLTPEQFTSEDGVNIISEACSRTGACYWLKVPFGKHEVHYNIELFRETGLFANKGTNVDFYPADSTKAAISFNRINKFYASNIRIVGLTGSLKSKASAVIQTNRSHQALIRDCDIDVLYNSDAGIIIGSAIEKGAIGSEVRNTRIVRSTGPGVDLIEAGGKHYLNEVQLRQNRMGARMHRGMLIVNNSEFDNNEEYSILATGDVGCYVNNSTFERTGFKASNLEFFVFEGSKTSSSFFDFENVEVAHIENSRLNGLSKLSGAKRLYLCRNYIQMREDLYQEVLDEFCNDDHIIRQNFAPEGRGDLAVCLN